MDDEIIIPGTEEKDPNAVIPPATDPWAEAFTSLEPTEQGTPEGTESTATVPGAVPPAEPVPPVTPVDPPQGDVPVAPATDRGQLPADTGIAQTGGDGIVQADIEKQIEQYTKDINDQAIKDVHAAFISKNIRNSGGKLGASVNDPDIYRRDSNGVATFYNPDTGKPFTGDDPRSQARKWVEDYNNELREEFNRIAGLRVDQLQKEATPQINLLKFVPTYEKLDPVRQTMLDSIIADYEVEDNQGNHVGYSCDLNQALAQVNRQIAAIQAANASQGQAAPATTPAVSAPPVATGPAVDMRTGSSGSASGEKPQFKSIAEAMEWDQNRQLQALQQKDAKRRQ